MNEVGGACQTRIESNRDVKNSGFLELEDGNQSQNRTETNHLIQDHYTVFWAIHFCRNSPKPPLERGRGAVGGPQKNRLNLVI